jgi:hypothetical protein
MDSRFQISPGLMPAVRLPMAALVTAGPLLLWAALSTGMIYGDMPRAPWMLLLLLPVLAVELAATRWLDSPVQGRHARLRNRLGLGGRLAFVTFAFFMLIGRAAAFPDSPEIYTPLLGFGPGVAWLTFLATPRVAIIGAVLLVVMYLFLTVWRGRFRMTTTVILPGLFALGLFHFWYAFPASPLHMETRAIEAPVQQVFPFDPPPGHPPLQSRLEAPRGLHVLPDEERFVASYGVTFHPFTSAIRPNLVRVDLANREFHELSGSVIRRFQSTCSDRLYLVPWHDHMLLGLDPATGVIDRTPLPRTHRDEPIEEINHVLHDCEVGRVFVSNSRNPVVIVWDTETRKVSRILDLVGDAGLRMGDSLTMVQPNPVLGRFYVGIVSKWQLLELDGRTLEPLRHLAMPEQTLEYHVTRDGAYLFISSAMGKNIWKVDARTFRIEATFQGPIHCRRIETTADGQVLIALGYVTGDVRTYDTATGRLLRTFYVGPKAEGMYVSERFVWVSTASGVSRIPIDALR